ncbi:MAG: DUF4332 domain-containing protein [Thiolinea sp.]
MNSAVFFVIGGMLLAWFMEWLYVYVTKNVPRKNQIKELEAAMEKAKQAHTETASQLASEVEALKAKLEKLTNEHEVVVAEAEGLRGELETIQQSVAGNISEGEAVAELSPDNLEEDTALEQEFAAAINEPADDAVSDMEPAEVAEPEDNAGAEEHAQAENEQAEAAVEIVNGAEPLTAEVNPDDLTRLTGIGPKTAELLNNAGVISFSQLADMDAEKLHVFLQENNIPHSKAKIMNWPEQAAQIANG